MYTRQDKGHLIEPWYVTPVLFSGRRALTQSRIRSRGNRNHNRTTEGTEIKLVNVDAVHSSYLEGVVMPAG